MKKDRNNSRKGFACTLVFDQLPGNYLILAPDAPRFTILGFNQTRSKVTMSDDTVVGQPLFEAFTDNPDNPEATGVKNLHQSLQTVLQTKKRHAMNIQRYDLHNPATGLFEERHWQPVNIPVIDQQGAIHCIIHAVEDVTESVLLKRKEEESQVALEQLLRQQTQILESITDGFIATDPDWTVQYWNKAAETIFKISREQILGKRLWDYIQAPDNSDLFANFQAVMQHRKPIYFETKHEGNTWLQVNAYPSEKGLTVFLLDITKQKEAAIAIRNKDQRYKALIEHIQDGIAILDENGFLTDISHSGEKIMGYPAAALKVHPHFHWIHPDDLPRIQHSFHVICRHAGKSGTFTYRVRMEDDTYKWIEANYQNLLQETSLQGIILTFRDISKRKEAEEQLMISEKQYRYLFSNSPASIIIWTIDDLKIQAANQAAIRIFGYTSSELLEKTIIDLCPAEEQERMLSLVTDLRQAGQMNSGIWKRQKKNGEVLYMDLVFHHITYQNEHAVMGLGINVSERIRLQQKLEEERNRRQDEITEAVLTTQENERSELGKELHDNINQILTTSRLFIEHALSKKENTEELLQKSTDYLNKAIKEIRQLSRRLTPPDMSEFSLKEDLDELFANIKELKGINFQFDFLIDPSTEIAPQLKLTIFRIVQEKLNNIIKHAHATTVQVGVYKKSEHIYLLMHDNGIGFKKEQHLRGMGLRNIKSRAHLLGGQVDITSSQEQGTRLLVKIPLHKKQMDD